MNEIESGYFSGISRSAGGGPKEAIQQDSSNDATSSLWSWHLQKQLLLVRTARWVGSLSPCGHELSGYKKV